MPIVAGHVFADALSRALGLDSIENMTEIEIKADWHSGEVAKIKIEMLATTEMVEGLRNATEMLRSLANVEVAERDGQRRILLQEEGDDSPTMPPTLPPDNRSDG